MELPEYMLMDELSPSKLINIGQMYAIKEVKVVLDDSNSRKSLKQLSQRVMDYSGGYLVHLASGVSGFTATYWVGPRGIQDMKVTSPNNLLLMVTRAGILWMGWIGFKGGDPSPANVISSVTVLNNHIYCTTSILLWTWYDIAFYGRPTVVGAKECMITGLVCLTLCLGLVQGWAALVTGIVSGTVPWYIMMSLCKRSWLLPQVDDTMGLLHNHIITEQRCEHRHKGGELGYGTVGPGDEYQIVEPD